MAGRIERVAPGTAAEAALAGEIGRAQATDRLAPVWVVVGSPIVALSLRRRLAAEGAFASVRFTPMNALLQHLGGAGAAAGGRRPLTQVALHAAARVALSESPGLLGPVAGHPATEASLAATYRDLRRLSDEELNRLASASGRAHDVVALVRVAARLLEVDYYDTADLRVAALRRLEGRSAGAADDAADGFADIGRVVVYLPDPLQSEETGLLAALAGRLDVVVLAAVTGDEVADRAVERFVARLAGLFAPGAPSGRRLDREGAPESHAAAALAERFGGFLSAPDEDVEVREAVRRLVAHAEAGGDLGRCVVAYPDSARTLEVGRRVCEQLKAAGIPCSGGAPSQLSETPHARLLSGLVELAKPVAPGHELERGEVMAWLASGPIRSGHGLTRWLGSLTEDGGLPVGTFDRCSRSAGVLSGMAQWRSRLGSQVAQLQEETPGAHSERRSRAARAAGDLLQLVERLHALTSSAAAAKSWRALQAWSEQALQELLDPGEDRTALAEALDDLDGLDGLEPLDALPSSERVRRFALALQVALERPAGDRGRFGVGPTVASLHAVAGLSSDLLLLLGCREGDLPARQRDDPLVPRAERERFEVLAEAEGGEETARRHLVWAASGAARSQASYARIDVRAGRAVHPSPWIAERFGGETTEVHSFAASLRRVADGVAAADVTDFELGSLLFAAAAPTWLEALDDDYGRRRDSLRRRRLGGLNPFAGFVPASGAAEDAWSDALSATGLESFATCPFRFFVDRKLGVNRLEAPERLVMIDARDRGTMMHAVLEGFFGDNEGGRAPAALDSAALARLRRLAATQFELLELAGKTGKAIFWHTERGRIERDLERYVERDIADSAALGRVPLHVELDFGGDGGAVAEVVGRRVMFRGRIDRVDVTGDGRLVVVDYKSGRSEGFQDILTDPLGRGRHLQLPIYAKAAADVVGREMSLQGPTRAEYRFVQSTAGYAVIPVELTAEVDAALHDVLETLVSTIDAGCFPPHPGPPRQGAYENCRYCDYDALCTTDRAELWERASTDAEMAAYVELVGPL
jgi:RecB family exonuclease